MSYISEEPAQAWDKHNLAGHGWTMWYGEGNPPVEDHVIVDVMFRSGKQHHSRDAGNWMWFWGKYRTDVDITCEDDIIAYRVSNQSLLPQLGVYND